MSEVPLQAASGARGREPRALRVAGLSSSLLLASLEWSDTNVYEP